MPKLAAAGFKHMSIHKRLLIQIVSSRLDWREFFVGLEPDATKEDVLFSLNEGPELHTPGCDNVGPDGTCQGHKRTK